MYPYLCQNFNREVASRQFFFSLPARTQNRLLPHPVRDLASSAICASFCFVSTRVLSVLLIMQLHQDSFLFCFPGHPLPKASTTLRSTREPNMHAKIFMKALSTPMSESVGLLRELRHLRAASGPSPLYLSSEESPLESPTNHEVDDGAEKGHECAPA